MKLLKRKFPNQNWSLTFAVIIVTAFCMGSSVTGGYGIVQAQTDEPILLAPNQLEAQAVSATEPILALTVGDLIGAILGLVALVVMVGVLTYQWAKSGQPIGVLDGQLAGVIGTQAQNADFITPLEKLLAGQAEQQRQLAREFSETVLRAAQWVPGQTDNAVAAILTEITDGVPLEEKREGLRADANPSD